MHVSNNDCLREGLRQGGQLGTARPSCSLSEDWLSSVWVCSLSCIFVPIKIHLLNFADLGHAHLCHVHLTQAVKLHPKYPGLAALTSRVDEEVQREARSANNRPSELTVNCVLC